MNFKRILPYIISIGLLLIVSAAFFPDAFKGKRVAQPDRITATGKENEIVKFRKETGEETLWTNQIFGGMPTFFGGAKYNGNLLRPIINNILMLRMPQPVGYFFLTLLCAYLMFIILGVNPWLSVVGSLASGLCTYNFIIYEAGHDAKLFAIAFFPLVAAGVLLTYHKKKYLLGTALFAFAFGCEIMTGHIQMVYYLGLALLVYVIVRFIFAIKEGELPSFVKASSFLLVGALLAISANGARLFTSYEYMKETMRGPAILANTGAGDKDSKTGLQKDYVFRWSHGIAESLTFLVPGAFGGGSSEKIGKDSKFYKEMRRKGAPASALEKAPMYWGDMPMTSGPVYFGAIVCFLFVLGLLVVKGELKWWLLFATLLTVLLSYGKNLMWFSDLFYYYFPMYDKFRAVSSILVIPQFTLSLLGILGLSAIIQGKVERKTAMRALYISLGVVGGLCVLVALLGGGMFGFEGASDARMKEAGYAVGALVEDRKSLMRSDALRSLLFVLLSGGLVWAYLSEKVKLAKKEYLLIGGLAVLMLFDLGMVGRRYLDSSNFVSERKYQANFQERPVDKQIKQDKDPNFRVMDASINTFNSNQATYHHKTIGGYHAVKLRRYQDMIDKHIGRGNMDVLNMLNTKYFITQKGEGQQNPGALGNVWFVSDIKKVATPDEEIASLEKFDPKTTAFIHNEFDDYLGGFTGGDGQGEIVLSDYKPNKLTYSTNASTDQLAVFSEVWYNPAKGKGWQAYLDGEPVDHIRANYVLRAIKVPAGNHKITFEFSPNYFKTGNLISLASSSLLLLLSLGALVKYFLDLRKGESLEEETR